MCPQPSCIDENNANSANNRPDGGVNNVGADAGGDMGLDLTCDPEGCTPLLNADVSCENGRCVYTCRDGFDDCDGTLENGCEADLASPETCNGCGNLCPVVPATFAVCIAGECAVTCEEGRADCDGSLLSGCEANLSSVWTCGDCNTRCGSRQLCWDGQCEDFDPAWAYEVKGDRVEIWDAAAMGDGVVVAGEFFDEVDLDVELLVDPRDSFIVGLDGNGAAAWASQIFTSIPFGLDIERVRVFGDTIYLVGWADGETQFGSAATAIATPSGDRDAFIATIGTDGTWGWARTYGTSGSYEAAQDIVVTSTGELIVGFTYQGPGNIGLGQLPADTDAYRGGAVVRLDAGGTPIAQQPLSPDYALSDPKLSLSITSADDVIVGFANNSDSLTVDGNTIAGFGSVLARLDVNLNVIWLRGLSLYPQSLTSLTTSDNRVYTVTDFEPPYDAGADLVSISLDGFDTWSRKIPRRAFLGPVVDSSDRVFTSSRVNGVLGDQDALLLAHDRRGIPIWSTDVAPTDSNQGINAMSMSGTDRLLVVGSSDDPVTLAGTTISAGRYFVLSFPALP